MKNIMGKIAIFSIIFLVQTGCGGNGGGSSSETPPIIPPNPFTTIYCAGCPDPAPSTYFWAASSTLSLKIDGLPADNANMQAFADANQILVCLRQWENGGFKRKSCYDQTGIKPGTYNMEYFVWGGLGEFCPGDKWCSTGGTAYVELYVDDGVSSWHVYAIPDVFPPYRM